MLTKKPIRPIGKKDSLLKEAMAFAKKLMDCDIFVNPVLCFNLHYEYNVINDDFAKVFLNGSHQRSCHFLLVMKQDFLIRTANRSPWTVARGTVFSNSFYGIKSEDEFIITRSTSRGKSKEGKTFHLLKERFDRETQQWVKLGSYNFGCYEDSIPCAVKVSFEMNKFDNTEVTHNTQDGKKTGRLLEGN